MPLLVLCAIEGTYSTPTRAQQWRACGGSGVARVRAAMANSVREAAAFAPRGGLTSGRALGEWRKHRIVFWRETLSNFSGIAISGYNEFQCSFNPFNDRSLDPQFRSSRFTDPPSSEQASLRQPALQWRQAWIWVWARAS